MTLSSSLQRAAEEVVEHYNDHHADTVLFIARELLDRQEATDAEITGIDKQSITFAVHARDGVNNIDLSLKEPITALEHVSGNFLQLLQEAREQAGSKVPKTSIETELSHTASLSTFMSTVKSVRQITSTMKEITFSGGLDDFESPGWDAFMFVLVPEPGRELPDDFTMADWRSMPVSERPGGAYYTIRRERPGELDLWFVIHETYGAVSDWATRAKPGDKVALWGPRIGFAPPAGTGRYLLLADETAQPAVAAILDGLPADVEVTVIAEADSPDSIIELRSEPGWDIRWVFRNGVKPGASEVMINALEELTVLPSSGLYVFGAAEASQIAKVQKYLKQHWPVTKHQVHLTGYWRRG